MNYRIFYHHGPNLGLSTKVEKGRLEIDGQSITIQGKGNTVQISFAGVKDVQLVRLHNVGRVIRIAHADGTLFLSVIRFMFGQFALVNFVATGKVFRRIDDATRREHDPSLAC